MSLGGWNYNYDTLRHMITLRNLTREVYMKVMDLVQIDPWDSTQLDQINPVEALEAAAKWMRSQEARYRIAAEDYEDTIEKLK
jgi:hypothetical protein